MTRPPHTTRRGGLRWQTLKNGIFLSTAAIVLLHYLNAREVAKGGTIKNSQKTTSCNKHVVDGDDAATVASILFGRVNESRSRWIESLRKDYGDEYFQILFFGSDNETTFKSRGYETFISPLANPILKEKAPEGDDDKGSNAVFVEDSHDVSRERFQRKLLIKVLNAYTSSGSGGGSSSSSSRNGKKQSFVWATGGHSAAAGRGNLRNQSYTAVLERALKPIFRSAGVEFVGRNHAMGGMPSAPELALCIESIYGIHNGNNHNNRNNNHDDIDDVDLILWDFAMTDMPLWWRKAWFDHKRALHPNRPVLIDWNLESVINDAKTANRMASWLWTRTTRQLQDLGATTLVGQESTWQDMKQHIPDMAEVAASGRDMNGIPPYVRHFKCQGMIENGGPTCRDMKYTLIDDARCDNSKSQTSWHPGWRMHAITGNLMAFFVVDNLLEALQSLQQRNHSEDESVSHVLQRLQESEDADYRNLYNNLNLTANISSGLLRSFPDEVKNDPFPFFAQRSFCRTALMPSQQRAMLSESDHRVAIRVSRTEKNPLGGSTHSNPDMPLVQADDGRETDECPIPLRADYNDYYYTSQEDEGWNRLTFPNTDERRRILQQGASLQGIIVLCQVLCSWRKCPEGDLQSKDLGTSLLLRVNGLEVSRMLPISDNCHILGMNNTIRFPPNPSEVGEYTLEVKVHKSANTTKQSFFRITSMVII